MSLYQKYRPISFDAVIGQKDIINSIKSLLKQTSIPHAILLAGPSGTGKTTIARIMAKELGASSMEIIELNIANTNGVDFIRQLNEEALISPIMGNNKVYIFDETQQLTKEGSNCLLKLLEDPPYYSYFIICTTDPQKLIKPLRDRCLSYSLKLLPDKEVRHIVNYVSLSENLVLSDDIINLLVYKAEGCPRKALVSLDIIKNNIDDFNICTNLLADDMESERDIIDLVKAIINKKSTWPEMMSIYKNINVEPETIRITCANYIAGCLKNSKNNKESDKFGNLLELFLSGLTYGSGKSEILFLIYKASCL